MKNGCKGLPAMAEVGRVRCSMEERKPCESKLGMGVSMMAAVSERFPSSSPWHAWLDPHDTGQPYQDALDPLLTRTWSIRTLQCPEIGEERKTRRVCEVLDPINAGLVIALR